MTPNTKEYFQIVECEGHNPIIAAIDLGTNSCRLIIAQLNMADLRVNYFRARPKPLQWRVLDAASRIVKLGEGLQENGVLKESAIDRTIEALTLYKKKLDRFKIRTIKAVATQACRQAKNTDVLLRRAKEECGIDIEIIASEEEANLALLGCAAVLDHDKPHAIIFDIGGGSTEIAYVTQKEKNTQNLSANVSFETIDSISIPYGVVTTTEAVGSAVDHNDLHDILHEKIIIRLQDFVEKHNLAQKIADNSLQVTGSSGTMTTLAAYHLGLEHYERKTIDGMRLDIDDLHKVIDEIFAMTYQQRLDTTNIGIGRADYVLTGSVILKALCHAIPAKEIGIADRGVREGILVQIVLDILEEDQ